MLFYTLNTAGQSISGKLKMLPNETITLHGFDGLNTYQIAGLNMDEQGNFKLNYSRSDYGVGYLMSADNRAFIVILSGEDIVITGEALSFSESIEVTNSRENRWFGQYSMEHPKREQALSAWIYLDKIYRSDSLFSVQSIPQSAIQTEIHRIHKEDADFLASLPEESYASWFLPMRKLVSSVPVVAQYRTEEIPATVEAFRSLDYTDPRLYKSGLFRDAIESHYWLLENSGRSLDSVYAQMKESIDAMMDNLVTDEKIFNEVTDYLFDLLERHSLFQAAEYLALRALTQNSCTLNDNLANQLETYRAMKIGNTAPEIFFEGDILRKGLPNQTYRKLSDLDAEYIVVVFGASWCPKCTEELPRIAGHYAKWKSKGVDVVYISLDTEPEIHRSFSAIFPMISFSDYEGWNSKIAKDYYVFATPTMFLLDKNMEIILRPHSVKQIDSWVGWYLIQGNPLPSN